MMNQNIGIDISFEYNLELEGRVRTFRFLFLSENISNKRHIVKMHCMMKIETRPVVSICYEYAQKNANTYKISKNMYFIIGYVSIYYMGLFF
jgi:hypothetical protein